MSLQAPTDLSFRCNRWILLLWPLVLSKFCRGRRTLFWLFLTMQCTINYIVCNGRDTEYIKSLKSILAKACRICDSWNKVPIKNMSTDTNRLSVSTKNPSLVIRKDVRFFIFARKSLWWFKESKSHTGKEHFSLIFTKMRIRLWLSGIYRIEPDKLKQWPTHLEKLEKPDNNYGQCQF